MSTVSRTFEVSPPPEVVVPYLADFAHAEDWDPGTVSCVREGAGPVEVGASWHNTSKIAGMSTELTYTLEELAEDRIVLVGQQDRHLNRDDRGHAPGHRLPVTYTNDTEFNGVAKLAAPAAKLVFEKLGND